MRKSTFICPTQEHPFNRDGYRYVLAEPDPHAPFRQEFDESLEMAGMYYSAHTVYADSPMNTVKYLAFVTFPNLIQIEPV